MSAMQHLASAELMGTRIEKYGKAWVFKIGKTPACTDEEGRFETIESFARSLPKDVFKPTHVETRHGEARKHTGVLAVR